MGTASAKAFGDMLLVYKTIQTLDVSDNSFGKPDAFGIPAFCAGVAASPSLISVSTIFRHTSCYISLLPSVPPCT